MKKDIQDIKLPFTITLDSITKVNHIINNMENNSFHNHYHILYDICSSIENDNISYLEIGTYAGGSVSLVSSHEKVKNVVSIDLGKPLSKEVPIRNVEKFKNKNCEYRYFEGNSLDKEIKKSVKDYIGLVDILFIDGDHSYDGVINDFINYNDLVKPGGYIVFDDYMDNVYSPKVKDAVDNIVLNFLNGDYEIYGSLIYPEIEFTNLIKPSSNEFIIKKL